MNCLACGLPDSRVVDSRTGDGKVTTRRRVCESCKARWNTYERPDRSSLVTQVIGQPDTSNRTEATQGIGETDTSDCEKQPRSLFSGSDPVRNSEPSKLTNRIHNRMRPAYTPAFNRAFDGYVRREEKAVAYAIWRVMAKGIEGGEEALCNLVLTALAWQIPLHWAGDNWRFAKYFGRYLKARKWEDERPNQHRSSSTSPSAAAATDRYLAERATCSYHREIPDKPSSEYVDWCRVCKRLGPRQPRREGDREPMPLWMEGK